MARPLFEVVKQFLGLQQQIDSVMPPTAHRNPLTQELKESLEYEEKRPPFNGLIEIDFKVESLKHQLRAMIPDVSGRITNSMKVAIDQAVAKFDFDAEIRKRVDEAVDAEIRHIVDRAWRDMRWSQQFKDLVEKNAKDLVAKAFASRIDERKL